MNAVMRMRVGRALGDAARAAIVVAMAAGCGRQSAVDAPAMPPAAAGVAAAPPKGGIAIPAAVRENLGIGFAKVERRAVAETRRVPGQFELLAGARQEYRALLAGRVHMLVAQFQPVQMGEVLFTIDSPAWRQLQHEAVEAEGEIAMAQAALDVAHAHAAESRALLGKLDERLEGLAGAGVRNAGLESEAMALRSSLPRLDAETRAQEAALREAHEHYASRLNALASVTGLSIDALREQNGGETNWRAIGVLPVRAEAAGAVETLAVNEGGWLEQGALALSVVDPARLRFHAEAPQSDIALFREGQDAAIVPPQGGSVPMQSALRGTLVLGLTANAADRTISLYVTPGEAAPWARAGVGGFLEVTTGTPASGPAPLAVPNSAIIQDGLEQVFYRRDPKDPDRALRVRADAGASDGRWTVLRSGVKEGDEVVLEGAYALRMSGGAQQAPAGYHFHADGGLHKNH